MDNDAQPGAKPIITGYNPAAQPGSEPILPRPLAAEPVPARPTSVKINVQDGRPPVLPGLAPRPVPIAPTQPKPNLAPSEPALRPTPPPPMSVPSQPPDLTGVPRMPVVQAAPPTGQSTGQLMQAKIDNHPLFAGAPDANALRANPAQPVKHRSATSRILIWIIIILIILAPAAFVAYHFGLAGR